MTGEDFAEVSIAFWSRMVFGEAPEPLFLHGEVRIQTLEVVKALMPERGLA